MQEGFSNRLSSKALTYWQWYGFLTFLPFWLFPIAYFFSSKYFFFPIWPIYVFIVVFLMLTLLKTFIIPKIIWNRWRYKVSEHDINIQYGLWIVKHTIIPMVKVQHVNTKQGPLMKGFGLASVSISTAASIHEIPALEEDVAAALRNRISILARVVDEDV
ncbi:MAG: PH domain-containing protein [Syntrophomonadaceae bacterium]|nr:PH domain-containing protein [Syntrophomonadaceae bacterium]